jgi:hypothetical protein
MKKNIVREKFDNYDSYLTGSIDNVIKEYQNIKKELTKKGYSDITVETEERGDGYSSNTYYSIMIYGYRPETDEEFKLRKKREKARSELMKETELRQLQILKEKYEK